ncbi:MAG: hypothetical protein GEU98_22085 [Pseudonocardiaceae bacterium]|nr:hypothetical protein [Pseudonocardiaceae bacterium]
MVKWAGSWLSGPRSALEPGADAGDRASQNWSGERLGLPESGAGAVASTGRRAAALLIDVIVAGLVAGLFTAPELPRNWSVLAWFLITVVTVSLFGFTPGKAVLGVRIVRMDGASMVGVPRTVVRTVLIFLIIPAVIWDADRRGLHDRAAGTIALCTR